MLRVEIGTVTAASYGRAGGSARVRLADWVDHLEIAVQELNYVDSSDNSAKTLARQPISVARAEAALRVALPTVTSKRVIMSRRVSPFSNGAIEEGLLRKAAIGVYDFDDLIGLPRNNGLQRVWSQSRTWSRAVRAADTVIAGNDFLAERASTLNPNTVVVPSCVQLYDYQPKADYGVEVPTVVWIGSPTTELYLQDIAPALTRLHDEIGLRLMLISSGRASLGVLDGMVDRHEWRPNTYARLLSNADVGVMPIRDDVWARGKCAYKLLQYGATGLPLVGSPVGANEKVLELAGASGPESVQDWYDALRALFELAPRDRRELGLRALSTVRDHYSFHAWEDSWAKAVGL